MTRDHIKPGDRLWNGATVTPDLAAAYNAATDRIASFEAAGRPVPESLLNGRHNLIASVPAPARIVYQGRRCYWEVTPGVYQATLSPDHPPRGTSGYASLEALCKLKGDRAPIGGEARPC